MNNYTSSSVKYVFKNFFYIVWLAILPALCMSAITCLNDSRAFYLAFFTGKTETITWTQIFNTFSLVRFQPTAVARAGFGTFAAVIVNLVTLLVLVLCASMFLAMLDKHMRIGKRTLNGIVGKINDNLMSTLSVSILFTVMYELFALIFSSLAAYIFTVIALKPLQYVLFFVALVALFGALLYCVSLLYLWLPCMQVTGFKAFEALRYSNQITEKSKRRIASSMLLSVIVGNAFVIPAIMFWGFGAYVVKFIVYMFFFLMFFVRMEIAYFDAAQIGREDLKSPFGDDKNLFEE